MTLTKSLILVEIRKKYYPKITACQLSWSCCSETWHEKFFAFTENPIQPHHWMTYSSLEEACQELKPSLVIEMEE